MINQKNRELTDIHDSYERNLQQVEDDLHLTRCEADDLKNEWVKFVFIIVLVVVGDDESRWWWCHWYPSGNNSGE